MRHFGAIHMKEKKKKQKQDPAVMRFQTLNYS